MEKVVMRGSRKRKHPSASSSVPFTGVSTRSKSQIHARRKYHPRPHPVKLRPPSPALQVENGFDSGEEMSRLSVKDLRARRVFSPASPIGVSNDKGGDLECSDDVRSLKNAEMDQVSHGNEFLETNPDAEALEQVENTGNGEVPNGVRNADMCGIEQIRVRDKDQCIQSTPPDDALSKPEADSSWSSVNVSKNLSNGRSNCVSNTKSVSNPCSRLKVFKVQNSLSYKRLLPYLMAVANESSCAKQIEKGSELDTTVQSSGPQCEEILGVNDFVSSEANVSTPLKGSCHDNEPGFVSPKDISGSQLSLAQKSCASKVEQCKPVLEVDDMIPIPETNLSVIPSSTPSHAQAALVQVTCNMNTFLDADLHPEASTVPALGNMSPIHESAGGGEIPNGVRNVDICGIEQISVLEGDQCIQSTPNVTLGKTEAHVSKNLSNGRSSCVSNTKSVLHPCSRLKVFKVPNSLSYKRLLPYLKAVANERPCAQEIEKGSELVPAVQSSVSQCEEILGEKSEADGLPIVHQVNDFVSSGASVSTPIKGFCPDNEPVLVSPTGINRSQLSLAQEGCASQVEQCKPVLAVDNMIPIPEIDLSVIPTSTPCHAQTSLAQAMPNMSSFRETDLHPETSLVPAHSNMSPIHEAYVHPETSPVQGLSNMSHIHEAYLSNMMKSSPCHLGPSSGEDNIEVEKRCLAPAKNEISTDVLCLGQDCSVAEMAVQLELPTAKISKGVLKRNPRGCRGLCTCLSCASFRLHAERAFEFSRNQMQDAEEVALDLIKELSHLRNFLHKSACGANAILQVSEVKNACRKASTAEESAKTRLGEMKDDLNHHCKITCLERPRVKFADCIKERIIYNGTLDKPGDTEG